VSIAGRILDASPGIQGHQNYYLFLTVLSSLGLAVVFALVRLNKRLTPTPEAVVS
jgi:hypothetical protein